MNISTETGSTSTTLKVDSTPLSRYEQALANFRCARRDLIDYNAGKLGFHLRGLLRAIFGV
jgi:hypothetical protein